LSQCPWVWLSRAPDAGLRSILCNRKSCGQVVFHNVYWVLLTVCTTFLSESKKHKHDLKMYLRSLSNGASKRRLQKPEGTFNISLLQSRLCELVASFSWTHNVMSAKFFVCRFPNCNIETWPWRKFRLSLGLFQVLWSIEGWLV
jgi:hypothetical protein